MEKYVIYQIMTRLFGNKNKTNKVNGTLNENGTGKFSDIDEKALKGIKELGITHVWYTGVIEHATMVDYSKHGIKRDNTTVVKGIAGSPYAIKDYYDVNAFLADNPEKRIEEFQELIKRTHENGMKVIIDFVPNHLSREYKSDKKPEGIIEFGENDNVTKAFDQQNNFYYIPEKEFIAPAYEPPVKALNIYTEYPAKATGNDVFSEEPTIDDWFETIKLNYGVDYLDDKKKYFDPIPATWIRMKEILNYWAEMGVDCFRCDMAEMVPYEFWGWVIPEVKKEHDVKFIAEIYNPKAYFTYINEGKFDYLYDKVGMYDTVRDIIQGKKGTGEIKKCLEEIKGFENNMLEFLENHDEQRIASPFFAENPMKALPGMALISMITGAPVMIYFGQEVGEEGKGPCGFAGDSGRTTIFDFWGVPAHQRWMNEGKFDGGALTANEKELRQKYIKLMNFVKNNEVFAVGEYQEIPVTNSKVFAFARVSPNDRVIVCVNFSETDTILTNLNIQGKDAVMQEIYDSAEAIKIDNGFAGIELKPLEIKVYRV